MPNCPDHGSLVYEPLPDVDPAVGYPSPEWRCVPPGETVCDRRFDDDGLPVPRDAYDELAFVEIAAVAIAHSVNDREPDDGAYDLARTALGSVLPAVREAERERFSRVCGWYRLHRGVETPIGIFDDYMRGGDYPTPGQQSR
jgi:hypothetical protein